MFNYNDGGRNAAGFKGTTGDCVVRAIAIATGKSYKDVYDSINQLAKLERNSKRQRKSNARNGVRKQTYEKYLKNLGWDWVPLMKIGTGCQVHLIAYELPPGVIICRLSKHLVTVIDGVIQDTFDPSRNGTRCVYGYFRKRDSNKWKVTIGFKEIGFETYEDAEAYANKHLEEHGDYLGIEKIK